MLFLKLIKGKVFALSPKPRPSWRLCHGDGPVSVFTVCFLFCGLCLQLAGKPSVLSRSTSTLSSHRCLIAVSTLVAFNCLTLAREIVADAWEREQGSCLLKKVQLQSGHERGQPWEGTPFPLNPTHPKTFQRSTWCHLPLAGMMYAL